MGAEKANIQASLCADIRIAKEQNSVSLEKRAEATYAEYRRQKASGSGGRPASVSSVRQLLSWRLSNHTVYGDLERQLFYSF